MPSSRRAPAPKSPASAPSTPSSSPNTDGSAAETSPGGRASGASPGGVRTLKKYPNRRLYDTQTSSYITLADVKQMVLAGEDFEVRDAKTAEDLTRSILLQIILEEESGGVPMFSSQTLAQIIRFYGHSMQGVMGSMLEKNLQTFTELQAQFMAQGKGLYDPQAFSPERWTQFLAGQNPLLQGMMGGYLEHSRSWLEQMQAQMKQAGTLFPGVPGFPPKG